MATTTATTASSNTGALDVPTLVSQLMTVANQPVVALQTQVSTDQAQISAWGTVSGLVSSFQTAIQSLNDSVISNTATPSDASVFSASAISTAVPGNYSLSVSQLAQAQTLVAAGQTSTSAAIGTVGDTLTINVGTTTPNNTFSASTTSGSATVTVASTANLAAGAPISGAGIPAGTTIASITDATHFVISAPATATGSGVTLQGGAAATFASSGSTSITINSSNNSLQGISDAINAANMGVSATIVNDGSSTPYRLVLTSNNSGASNSLQVTTTGSAALNTLLAYDPATTENMTQTVAAQNANLTVNGIAITSASNTVANAIQGVTLTLNNTTTAPATLTVAHDTAAVSTAASNFVSAYNTLSSQLTSDVAYGNASTGAAAGALSGDGTVRMMQQQLQSIFDTAATPASGGSLQYLAQIGIGFQANGTLALDSTTLNSAMTSNFSDVSNLISSTTGFGTTGLGAWCNNNLSPGIGLIYNATQSINTTITSLNSNISDMQARNALLQATYTTEYSNLNTLLSSLNNTSSYLTAQLNSQSK
jgi:flagellar hook-associated protein 2